MRPFCAVIFAVAIIFLGDTSLAVAGDVAGDSRQNVQIIKAKFGLFNSPNSGKPPFIETNTVPLKTGQGYGWLILLKTDKPTIKWREEFTLPSAPATWGEGKPQAINKVTEDKKTSIIEKTVTPVHGVIFNAWEVAPGDPKGHYVIRVIIESAEEQRFEFDVK